LRPITDWTRKCIFCERDYLGTSRIVRFEVDMPCCEECMADIVQMGLALGLMRSLKEGVAASKRFQHRMQNKDSLFSLTTTCPECKQYAPLVGGTHLGYHTKRNGLPCLNSGTRLP
jgi:hypothetical protein